jgi:enhancer of mRNA-decapping protein 4
MEALPTGKPQAEPKKKKRDKSPKPNGGSNKNKPVVQANPTTPKIAILKRGDEAPPASAAAVSASSADLEEVLKKSLAGHFKRQESFISDQVQKAVKSEIQTTVVPTLSKMMTQTMEQAVVKPVKAAIDKNAKERTTVQTDVIVSAVSGSVQEPLKNAFEQVRFNGWVQKVILERLLPTCTCECWIQCTSRIFCFTQAMTTALVPAYEVATREMFLQVAASVEKGLAGSQSTDSTAAVKALSAKLESMSLQMESLTSEVQQLRSALATSQGISPPGLGVHGKTPEPDAGQMIRDSILWSLKQGEYEAAFTQALSASAADMAVYCCKNANVSNVLGGNSPAISQPILLCLMQQLGAVLVSSSDDDLQTILLWLQESALTLVPTDESVVRHVSQVLQQLVSSVEAKMAMADPTLRRQLKMLLQVIQGMQR